MEKKSAIVTGAYGAIGGVIAAEMAKQGYRLTLVGRDRKKLEKMAETLSKQTGNKDVFYRAVDLSAKNEVERFAQSWEGPLHVLINNAATTPRSRETTSRGIEQQFATNVLGYFWMMQYFYPFMEKVDDARIVNVASYWAGDLDLNDLEFESRPYDNDTAYRQSKQANRMLTAAFAKRLSDSGIAVLAAHPGDVRSKLSNNLGHGGWESPEQGAANPLFCALDSSLKGISGKYYEHKRETPCRFAKDSDAVEKLYEVCLKY